jgi:DNA-binding NarL/FixJ family response regulator
VPLEAGLAKFLATGVTIKQASEKLNVSQSTLRSQLKSIFSKMDVNRQSELVRMLLADPLHFFSSKPPADPS